tara:strand:- start:28 stop:246 length:219 start_codon:yes stop_codon:yes gene_type:complete
MNIQTYLDYKAKFDRMANILGKYTMELNAEQMKPLIDDGFDLSSIVDYFTVELKAYAENRYTKPELTNENKE